MRAGRVACSNFEFGGRFFGILQCHLSGTCFGFRCHQFGVELFQCDVGMLQIVDFQPCAFQPFEFAPRFSQRSRELGAADLHRIQRGCDFINRGEQ